MVRVAPFFVLLGCSDPPPAPEGQTSAPERSAPNTSAPETSVPTKSAPTSNLRAFMAGAEISVAAGERFVVETRERFDCGPAWRIDAPALLAQHGVETVPFDFPTPQRAFRTTFEAKAPGTTAIAFACRDSAAFALRQAMGEESPPPAPDAEMHGRTPITIIAGSSSPSPGSAAAGTP